MSFFVKMFVLCSMNLSCTPSTEPKLQFDLASECQYRLDVCCATQPLSNLCAMGSPFSIGLWFCRKIHQSCKAVVFASDRRYLLGEKFWIVFELRILDQSSIAVSLDALEALMYEARTTAN